MTAMTPEERAREIWRKVDDPRLVSGECVAIIFSAIRDAENAKLEEAALTASNETIHPLGDAIAKAIRNLKSKE